MVTMTLFILVVLCALGAALGAPSIDSPFVDNNGLAQSDRLAVFFIGLFKHEHNITQRSLLSV